ncbi:MAG TPA: NF038122 family metalloprotease [Pyrinomonadaceae bacterium]|nr:NF038122 family metalloprotease [Pyrinomonadaceae bacterium]
MKNYRFPHFASQANSFVGRIKGVRALLILAIVVALSCLPFYVRAQVDKGSVSTKKARVYSAYDDGGAFIIYKGANGEAICRDATLAETRALRAGANDSGLRQINHLGEDPNSLFGPKATTSNLTIVLRATAQLDANPTAKAAFTAAAAKWEALIKDPITIIIDVDYGTTFFGNPFSDANVLGATSTQLLFSNNNYPDMRNRLINHSNGPSELALANALPVGSDPTDIGSVNTVIAASPLLRALGALPPDATTDTTTPGTAPKIAFNSQFSFDFDPSDGITGGRTDFDAVAVHEMGHALGFNSEVGARELDSARPLFTSVWDLFRFRPGTANLGNFGTAQRILTSGGSQSYFGGGAEHQLSTGRPDGSGGDGEQASHWKADEQIGGATFFIGIMDPTIQANRREVMQPADQEAIDYFGYTITATAPPPNDNFANGQVISGPTGSVSGSNVFGSKEAGEPLNPPGTGGGKSIWYVWTAPGTGSATFDTQGSTFDTILAAYTGSAVNSLTVLASNDDIDPVTAPEPRNIQSRITFNVTAGTTYRIQVDGFDADQGPVVLNWTGPGAATPTPTPTPGPNTVQFTQSTAIVSEAPNTTTKIDLTVTRSGNLIREATVDYATSDATATERSDYETARGTLFFAAGDSGPKTVTLFIINDAFGEAAETFNVTLSNSVNSTLGSPPAVQVTINSDESVNGNNPVRNATFDNDFFVRQHYLDFLSREPDAGGLNFWKGQLQECENVPLPGGFTDAQQCREIRRINVSAAFFLAIEFQETGYLVERLYKTAYGDATGTSTFGGTHTLFVPIVRYNEFIADSQQIGRGVVIGQPGADVLLEQNKQALIAQFVARSRFTTAFPSSMTPTQFVDALNTNAGGVLSASERNQLIADLTSSTRNRAQVLRAVAEDSDLVNNEKNKAFVLSQFIGYLRRNPNDSPDADYTGYDFWLQKLNQFGGNFVNAEMVKSFIISGEYQGRFGQ